MTYELAPATFGPPPHTHGGTDAPECTTCNRQPTEVRYTDPITGGQKGSKPERHSLIPPEALSEISKVYGYGAEKYDAHNWRKGYPWSLSYDALQRHLNAFWSGQDIDPESGLPHLAHAAFHVNTLLTWSADSHYNAKDDRP